MSYTVQLVNWDQAKEALSSVREQVFVCEWRIPRRQEFDQYDKIAKHVLISDDNGQPLATGRMLSSGDISRVAVIMSERKNDLATEVIKALLQVAKQMGLEEVYINSPLEDAGFLKLQGFYTVGAVFMEAGLPTQRMACAVNNPRLDHFLLSH